MQLLTKMATLQVAFTNISQISWAAFLNLSNLHEIIEKFQEFTAGNQSY